MLSIFRECHAVRRSGQRERGARAVGLLGFTERGRIDETSYSHGFAVCLVAGGGNSFRTPATGLRRPGAIRSKSGPRCRR
jgi:hypothetical protein